MSDIAICFDGAEFDLVIENGDLARDEGLETAVIISLFTNQRITPEELPDLEEDLGGWWADTISEINADQIGSRLWLMERSKLNDEVLAAFESYATSALTWMIEDGLASSIIVEADIVGEELSLDIQIPRPDDVDVRLAFLWDGQELKRAI